MFTFTDVEGPKTLYNEFKPHAGNMPDKWAAKVADEKNWKLGAVTNSPDAISATCNFKGASQQENELQFNDLSGWLTGLTNDNVLGWFLALFPLTLMVNITHWTNATLAAGTTAGEKGVKRCPKFTL